MPTIISDYKYQKLACGGSYIEKTLPDFIGSGRKSLVEMTVQDG